MDTNQKDTMAFTFRAYFSYDVNKHLHYIVQANEMLWVIERKTLLERSELVLKHRFEHVIGFKVKDDQSTGQPLVYISKLDGSEIVTNFIDKPEDRRELNKISMSDEPDELSKKCLRISHQIHLQKELHRRLIHNIGMKLRFGAFEDDQQKPSECLVRYGDAWKRIHNDQLVIGVPVLNSGIR